MNAADLERLDAILLDVKHEVIAASDIHPPFNSAHEGYAVIEEELDELWDEIKGRRGEMPSAMLEATQVAAMGVRYILNLKKGFSL